jgi:N-acetyl-gamma-glutamyl-phosphate reductase
MDTAKVAVLGASGYSGEELIAILSRHPRVDLVCVTSRQLAGKKIGEIMPRFALGRFGGIPFVSSDIESVSASGATVAFLALPHGLAHEFAQPLLERGLRVIDLSADFRIRDAAVYADYYGADHPAPALLPGAIYGMPEWYRDQIRSAKLIAAPGCYPTSIVLPLAPLLRGGLLDADSIVANSLSGVSGAGRKTDPAYLYAECNESARAYGIPKHRHLSEIEQELAAAHRRPVTISFAPHLVPLTRGILTTIHVGLSGGVTPEAVGRSLCAAYGDEPFVRLLGPGQCPEIKWVANTNFIDIGWQCDPRTGRLILMSAIDNLVKGASGQAVQSLNLICGWPETLGLRD